MTSRRVTLGWYLIHLYREVQILLQLVDAVEEISKRCGAHQTRLRTLLKKVNIAYISLKYIGRLQFLENINDGNG